MIGGGGGGVKNGFCLKALIFWKVITPNFNKSLKGSKKFMCKKIEMRFCDSKMDIFNTIFCVTESILHDFLQPFWQLHLKITLESINFAHGITVSILGSAPQGGSPTEQTSDEEMERGLSEWRRINVLYECDCMNVCMYVIKYENKHKEWHHATKRLKKKLYS
jgi:hypothetical protein